MGNVRNIGFWVVLFLLVLALFNLINSGPSSISSRTISYSDFVQAVDKGDVASVTLDGEKVLFRGKDGSDYVTIKPDDAEVTQLLIEARVPLEVRRQEESGFSTVLMTFLPFVILIGVWIYFMNRMQGGGRGGAMGFGKSKAKLLTEKHGRVTFDDVAGIDEAKEELEEIVEFLRNPQKFSRLGGKIPRGALLVGAPGTGKTLLARAIAGEAGVPFFSISGSDFVEMFVGVGASRVRDMFEQAKKNAPCIIFIDEIDAVGRHRGAGLWRRQRRARADAQPAPRGDGRLRGQRGRDHHRRHQPTKTCSTPPSCGPGRFDRQIHGAEPRRQVGREAHPARPRRARCRLAPDVDLKHHRARYSGLLPAPTSWPTLVNESALSAAARRGKRIVVDARVRGAPRTR